MHTHEHFGVAAQDNFDDNSDNGLPRDFDVGIDAAKQQVVLSQNQETLFGQRWHCSDYDF